MSTKYYLDWQEVNTNWEDLDINWEDVFILIEAKQKAGGGSGNIPKVLNDNLTMFRKLTPIECERLQSVPYNYTNCVSNNQRYRMLGNGWTVDVIAHIFSFLKEGGNF